MRHADAGSRDAWEGDDRVRPLSPKGRLQADGVRRSFADRPITRVVSSPAVRCVQTVEPLAASLGLEIETADVLFEGSWVTDVIAFAESIDGTCVLSSHGDVIPAMLRGLVDRGMTLLSDFRWAKGSTWIITRDRKKFTDARYVEPLEA